jgi:Flp pilus assembly protein TadG
MDEGRKRTMWAKAAAFLQTIKAWLHATGRRVPVAVPVLVPSVRPIAGRPAFLRNNRGTAAVEFALIVGPLFFMIFACIELSMVILVSTSLDNATAMAARQIRTGVMTQANSTAATFKTAVCGNMGWLAASCSSSLMVDVQTYNSFAQVPTTDLIKNGNFDTANFAYVIGAGSQIQMVRTYYDWKLFTQYMNAGLSTLSNGDAVLSSKIVFRNEPF